MWFFMNRDWQHSVIKEITSYLIQKQFWLYPGKSVKLTSSLSFYLICRIYLQLTHLAPPRLNYFMPFSCISTSCFVSIWAEIVLIYRISYFRNRGLCLMCFPIYHPPRKSGPRCTWNQAARCKDGMQGSEARCTRVQVWIPLLIGSGLGQGSSPLWCSQSDERESSLHTRSPLRPCLPHC